jgi:hypothetical protein
MLWFFVVLFSPLMWVLNLVRCLSWFLPVSAYQFCVQASHEQLTALAYNGLISPRYHVPSMLLWVFCAIWSWLEAVSVEIFTDSVQISDCITYYIRTQLQQCTWNVQAFAELQYRMISWVQYSHVVQHVLLTMTISIGEDGHSLVSDQYTLIQEVLQIQSDDTLIQWMVLCTHVVVQLVGLNTLVLHNTTQLSGQLGTLTISYDALVHCCHRLALLCRECPIFEKCTRFLLNPHFVQIETVVRTQQNAARLVVHKRSRDVKWMAYLAQLQSVAIPAVWTFLHDDSSTPGTTTTIPGSHQNSSTETGEWIFQSPATVDYHGVHHWLSEMVVPAATQHHQPWATVCQSGHIFVAPGSQMHVTLPPTSDTNFQIVRVYIASNAELWLHGGNYGESSTVDISLIVFGDNAHLHFCPHGVHEIFVHHHRRSCYPVVPLRTWERVQLDQSVCVLGQESIPKGGYPTTIDGMYKDLTSRLDVQRQLLQSCSTDPDRVPIQKTILTIEMELENLYGIGKRVTTIGTSFFLHSANN